MAKSTKPTTNGILHNGVTLAGYLESQIPGNVRPEDFGAKGDGVTDDTVAINNMFASGRIVLADPSKVYKVSGIINSKGQKVLGWLNIETSRRGLGVVEFNSDTPTPQYIRIMYVSSAYDLSELMAIKALGFNTLHHYIDWSVSAGNEDANGSVAQLLDNAQTAGIKVQFKTESQEEGGNALAFVSKYHMHPACFGFSVYDEPATRNIPVATQKDKYNMLRGVTTKPLTVVDLMPPGGGFKKELFEGYDITLVDSYALKRTTAQSQWFEEDMQKHRRDFGALKYMVNSRLHIPVVSCFLDIADNYYSSDEDQIVKSSREFAMVGNGHYGCFLWDGHRDMTNTVRTNAKFRALCKELSGISETGRKTEAFAVGGTPVDGHWPLHPLIDMQMTPDAGTSDARSHWNAYPIRLVTGSSETDRTTTTASTDFSGLAFKGSGGGYVTGFNMMTRLTFKVECFAIGQSFDSSGNFTIAMTEDNGYTIKNGYVSGISGAGGTLTGEVKPLDYGMVNPRMVLRISNPNDATTRPRKFVRGYFVATNW